MVGEVAVGADGVNDPAYGVALGLEPRAKAGSQLVECASVRLGQQLLSWVNWRGNGHEPLVGCLRPDDLFYHPPLLEASG